MSKSSPALVALPPQPLESLQALGLRLRALRQQRGLTLHEMAARLFCTPATLRALESGKPGTSIGLLAHALWLLGQADSLQNLAPLDGSFAAAQAHKRVRRSAARSTPGTIAEGERDF